MIIECPACTTRYDIKATLPPEGRTVRCAKCKTAWRAMPEIAHEQAAADAAEAAKDESAASGAGEQDIGYRADSQQAPAPAQTHTSEWSQDGASEESTTVQETASPENYSAELEEHQPQLKPEASERISN